MNSLRTEYANYLVFSGLGGLSFLLKRINTLIKDVIRSPFEGIGKPETKLPSGH